MATYYVRKTGNDGNAGTSAGAAKLTLNGAEDIPLVAGDVVVVGSGVYRESLTVDVSGSAGNPITYIGDYTGALTGDAKGVVRITGSADDIALTRASCITGSSKNYRTFRGFRMDLTSSHPVSLTTCDHWIIEQCHITRATGGTNGCIDGNHLNTNHIFRNCFFDTTGSGVTFGTSAADNSGNLIESCVILCNAYGVSYGVFMWGVGGTTVRNCTIIGATIGGIRGLGMNVGQTITVNNNIVYGCATAFASDSTARFTEDYNTISACGTARSNVTAGGNSVTRPPLWDTRWFFEAVNGGRLITPFDLASYSTLVELNSGTGAPSTDLRGTAVQGTYREWGASEYDSTLKIAAGGGLLRSPGMGGGIDS